MTLRVEDLRVHGTGHLAPDGLWSAWAVDPLALVLVLGAGALYGAGLLRSWRRSRRTAARAACFATGLAALALALVSPLHALGGMLFAAHMTQHMVLMVVAAPLLVLGAPGVTALWALPRSGRRRLGSVITRRWTRSAWRVVSAPTVAWSLHAAALWLWHAPALYQRTVEDPWVHTLQHATLFGVSLLFWWVALRGRGERQPAAGVRLAFMFTTAVHASLLGALIAFSARPWYPVYTGRTAIWGLDPLADQQLGGLVMWVPGGITYVVAFLWLFARWIGEAPARARASAPPRLTAAHHS